MRFNISLTDKEVQYLQDKFNIDSLTTFSIISILLNNFSDFKEIKDKIDKYISNLNSEKTFKLTDITHLNQEYASRFGKYISSLPNIKVIGKTSRAAIYKKNGPFKFNYQEINNEIYELSKGMNIKNNTNRNKIHNYIDSLDDEKIELLVEIFKL